MVSTAVFTLSNAVSVLGGNTSNDRESLSSFNIGSNFKSITPSSDNAGQFSYEDYITSRLFRQGNQWQFIKACKFFSTSIDKKLPM
jgi:hypothetical protein